MANVAVLGCGPLSFVDANGRQHELPLSLVTFDSTGRPTYSGPDYQANVSIIDQLLKSAADQGLLLPKPMAAPLPVMIVAAVRAGSSGNAISLAFANQDESTPAVDVSVSAREVSAAVVPTGLAALLGSVAGGGTVPGLAFVSAQENPATLPLTGTVTFTKKGGIWVADIPAAGNAIAFTLQATTTGNDAALLTASVDQVTATSFTLTLAWIKHAAAVPLVDLKALNATFGYIVSFAPPVSGAPQGAYRPPAPGSVVLSNGVASRASAAASIAVPDANTLGATAFVLGAALVGSLGNAVSATFANAQVGSPATVDVTIVSTKSYPRLTPSSLSSILGDGATAGTIPGLAIVLGPVAMPADSGGAASAFIKLTGGGYGVDIKTTDGTKAFSLKSVLPDAASVNLIALVTIVDATNSTFALTIRWTKSVAKMSLKGGTAFAKAFGAIATLAAPAAQSAIGLPVSGTYTLAGGIDGAKAVVASATLKSS